MANKFFIFLFVSLFSVVGYSETLKFGIAQSPQNLHPHLNRDAASEKIVDLVYEKIFDLDFTFNLTSDFIEYEKINDKRYLLKIKQFNNFFSNGQKLTEKDILFSIQSNIDNPLSKFHEGLNIIESIQLSKNNILIKLKNNDPYFLYKLCLPIIPFNIKELGVDLSLTSLGSGNFKILETKPNVLIERSDGLIVKFIEIKDPSVRALKIINREIDLLQNDLPLPIIKLLQNKRGIYTETKSGHNVSYIGFNHQDHLVKDKAIRKAIAHAINQKEIIQYFFNEQTKLANQLFTSEHWAYTELKNYDFNPQLSKQILVEAGYQLPINLELKTSTDPFRIKIATIIQSQLKQVGINLKIKSLDWSTFYKDIQNGNFQIYALTWVGLKSPEIYKQIFFSKMTPPFGLNRGFYESLEMDNLINNALEKNNWQNVVTLMHEDILMLPLWFEGNFMATLPSISNYRLYLDGSWVDLSHIRKND